MRGHIRERSAGHWAIVLDVHDRQEDADANGIPSVAPSERGSGRMRPSDLRNHGRDSH